MRIVIGTPETWLQTDSLVLLLDRIAGIDGEIRQMYITFSDVETDEMMKTSLWNPRVDGKSHNQMMNYFYKQDWGPVNILLIALSGAEEHHSFCGRLNSFYNSIYERLEHYQTNPPPPDWDGIFKRPVNPDK